MSAGRGRGRRGGVLNGPGATGRRLDVEVLTGGAAFAALEAEWDDLHRNSTDAWPHESWAFLYSWWEIYGAPYRLRVMTMRAQDTGQLVGVLPLMVGRRRGLRTLLFLVDNEPLDVLVRDGWGGLVEAAVPDALRALRGWDVAELRPVRPGARMWRMYRQWRGPCGHAVVTPSAVVPARTEEEVLAAVGKNQRHVVRKALRRAERDGLECRAAARDRVPAAVARLVELHREMWTGRGLSAQHADDAWPAFLARAAGRMAERGLADVVEWTRDGRVEISQLFLYGPDAVHAMQVGASRYAVDRLQWSALCVWEGLARARARGLPYLDLAYGDEPYKARWRPRALTHHRLRLARGLLGYGFFALAGLRRTVRALSGWRSRRRAAPRSPAPSRAPGA